MCKALQRALHSACSVISSNFGCAFLEYQMFKYRGITLAYLFVPFYISFTFKIFQTLHYFIFPFATRKLHYKRHILNFVILLWSDRYLVSVLISQKTPHAATAFNHTFVTLHDLKIQKQIIKLPSWEMLRWPGRDDGEECTVGTGTGVTAT